METSSGSGVASCVLEALLSSAIPESEALPFTIAIDTGIYAAFECRKGGGRGLGGVVRAVG
jgi:hypothetical protein